MSLSWMRHASRLGVLFLAGLLLLVSNSVQTSAQEVSAGITGIVTDPSGAAIAGATVSVRDVDRGTNWSTQTNVEGDYAFPRIPSGRYELTVRAEGFRSYLQPDVLLEVNQRAPNRTCVAAHTRFHHVMERTFAKFHRTETTNQRNAAIQIWMV